MSKGEGELKTYFMCRTACMYVCEPHMEPEEGVGSPGIELMGGVGYHVQEQ